MRYCGKRDADGTVLSSVSAPWVQARMIAQAGVGPGMRVLEIGSGGYNAALIAEITGTSGHVVSVDIDAEVTARASAALQSAGYGDDRVTVVTADAARCVPGDIPYDAVIVTAGAWDLPPCWLSAVADDAALVVPLRMNGVTRSVELRRFWDRWVSASVQTCGFVNVQGSSARSERAFPVSLPSGRRALVRFEDHAPPEFSVAEGVLAAEPLEAWSGVTVGGMESIADLFLWCSGFVPGFCRVTNDDSDGGEARDTGLRGKGLGRYACACARENSLAWLDTRKITGDVTWELGVRGAGPCAAALAKAMLAEIREWDGHGRHLPDDAITYWPAGTYREPVPGKTAVYRKALGTATVTWPAISDERSNSTLS
jgi:protein-L-isoaspartate(D-aspartate) O-methyltransferase